MLSIVTSHCVYPYTFLSTLCLSRRPVCYVCVNGERVCPWPRGCAEGLWGGGGHRSESIAARKTNCALKQIKCRARSSSYRRTRRLQHVTHMCMALHPVRLFGRLFVSL